MDTALGQLDDSNALLRLAYQRLTPAAAANVTFLVLITAFLLAFVFWRCFRYLFLVLVCREKHDHIRKYKDPNSILFTRSTTIIKGCMLVFALVVLAFSLYGIATADKNLITSFWAIVTNMRTVFTNLSSNVGGIADAVGGVSTAYGEFDTLVVEYVKPNGFQTHSPVRGKRRALGPVLSDPYAHLHLPTCLLIARQLSRPAVVNILYSRVYPWFTPCVYVNASEFRTMKT